MGKNSSPYPKDLGIIGEYLRIVAEPKRLLILNLIMEGIQCNCDLSQVLNLSPNLVSHHLSILREAGLVNVERDLFDARWVYYSVDRAALEQLRATLVSFFDPSRIQPRRSTCGPQAPNCVFEAEPVESGTVATDDFKGGKTK